MESCVIYCRESGVSTLPTDVKFDDQEQVCREHAAKHGYGVFKVYRESHSGADLKGRKLMWEAIEDIRRGDAQVLLVRNYDRLSREPNHQGVILYEVEEKEGGRIEAVLEPIDPNDIEAGMMRSFRATIAKAERLRAVYRMENGKMRRAERGHLPAMSNPLFGYAFLDDEPDKRTTYIPDLETAPIVERIFRLAMAGQTLRAIARLLTAEQVPTPSQWVKKNGRLGRHRVATKGWTAEQVRRIVSDRTYTGEATAYRWQRVPSKNGKPSLTLRPADDPKRIRLSVPALVDTATYDAANKAVQARETTGRPPIDQEASWLRLHVYCGVCGARMGIKRCFDRKGDTIAKYEYECRNKKSSNTNGNACKGGDFSVRAHLLDGEVYRELANFVIHREEVRRWMVKTLGTDKRQALIAMAESFQVQLTAKREELDSARRLAIQTKDAVLREQFMHDAETLNADIHALEQDYAEAREELDTFTSGQAWVDEALELVYAASTARLIYVTGGMPGLPTPEDIAALPYPVKRLLLAATGLRCEVFPVGYREDGRRMLVRFDWDISEIMSHPTAAT